MLGQERGRPGYLSLALIGGALVFAAGCQSQAVPAAQPVAAPVLAASSTQNRPLPEPAGPIALADPQGRPLVTIRVSAEVAAAGDPRYRAADKGYGRYANYNSPWKWTDEQRTYAAALDLRDLLTRMLCGADADLAYVERDPSLAYRGLTDCAVGIGVWDDSAGGGSIRVGRPRDFIYDAGFELAGLYNREQHLIRTTTDGILLLGAEGAGVERAVWTFASALGYRYLLPTRTWEIVPDHRGRALVAPAIDRRGGPSDVIPGFVTRTLSGPLAKQPGYDFAAWSIRNGLPGSLQMKGIQGTWGHIYGDDRDWYDKNPGSTSESSRPKVHGQGYAVKFCPDFEGQHGQDVSERIVAQWAHEQLSVTDPASYNNDITRDQLPLHHGDASFWAGCAPKDRGGATPADRALHLANRVAESTRADGSLGQRKVGLLGYRELFAGPLTTRADPDVFVYLVGSGYLGTTFDSALSNWRAAGVKQMGAYLYWDAAIFDLPMESGPQALVTTARQLARLEERGVRSLWISTSGGWGANGLFRWILTQIALDPSVARTDPQRAVDELLSVVLEAFPPAAREPIRSALASLDVSDRRILLSPDWIADLYRALGAARTASIRAHDPAAQARVEDILVYARHLELYWRMRKGIGSYDDLIEHAYCNAERAMIDYRDLWHGPTSGHTSLRSTYLDTHGDRDPEAVMARGARCPQPNFDAWIKGTPKRQLTGETAWYESHEGPYTLPTSYPGTADVGTFEQTLHDLPRDTLLWRAWIDPSRGFTIHSACHGVSAEEGSTPAREHLTSRLLGEARIEIRTPDGSVACSAELPPSRQAWDLVFERTAPHATASETLPERSVCRTEPRTLALDTGVVDDEVHISCDPKHFSAPGLYDIYTINHRTGLDYATITGVRGLVRWETPQTPNEERRPDMGARSRYFFVPSGTKRVALWSDGSRCTVHRDAIAAHRVDLSSGAPEYHVIPVKTPDGIAHDGEIWGLSSCKDAYLVNLPPVLAPEKTLLMAPCTLAQTPGYAPLALEGCPIVMAPIRMR